MTGGNHAGRGAAANIVLLGFMGCGKTTAAAKLAEIGGLEAVETDEIIARRAGMSIPEIFAREGEEGFRARETAVLREALAGRGRVISCGGGVVTRPENAALLREAAAAGNCIVIRLMASPETVFARIGADPGRPMLKDVRGPEDIARLMARREDAYRAAGGAEVATDGRGAEEIAREILKIASDGAEDPDTAGED